MGTISGRQFIEHGGGPNFLPECPGPIIFVTEGDTVNVTLENDLAEPHAFFIPASLTAALSTTARS